MNPDVQARAFDPFFSTKFGQGGNGLGLSICHNIVETLMGGCIELRSESGLGTRFILSLPTQAPLPRVP